MNASRNDTILVTGASGHLGQLVIAALLKRVPAQQLTAAMRDPASAAGKRLAAQGVKVVAADYTKPETLERAFQGISKLLLISSSDTGRRAPQHLNVIDAAKKAGVSMMVYTSSLRADTAQMMLAVEHRETEAKLKASGIPHVILRNGWYTDNLMLSLPKVLQKEVVLVCSGDARWSMASRQDYAEAAAMALTSSESLAGKVYELAGDQSFTMAEYAAELSRQTGKHIAFKNLPPTDFRNMMSGAGVPEFVVAIMMDSEAAAVRGELFDDSHQLSRLIGRTTTPFAETLRAALASMK